MSQITWISRQYVTDDDSNVITGGERGAVDDPPEERRKGDMGYGDMGYGIWEKGVKEVPDACTFVYMYKALVAPTSITSSKGKSLFCGYKWTHGYKI